MSTPAHFIEVEKLEPKPGHRIAAYLLTDYLEKLGVEVIFGLCGHTVIALLDALGKSKIRFISCRHEQVAAHAADGYARVRGVSAECNLGGSGSVGSLKTAAIGYFEVYDGRGDFDFLSSGGCSGGLLMLHQLHVFFTMNCGQNVGSGKIQDDPTRTALHGLCP